MIRLIQLLIFGHVHKWKIIQKAQVMQDGIEQPVRTDYDCQCETCGAIRLFKC